VQFVRGSFFAGEPCIDLADAQLVPPAGRAARPRHHPAAMPWTKMRQVYGLLGLVNKWGAERVEAACASALAHERSQRRAHRSHARTHDHPTVAARRRDRRALRS